ncbi:MAG: DUF2029 domain-containing protein [Deltaproteobacteria bacterium]|nr:DUF2029 domain-containing protein [Deltaproteobacteria bacterium]
MNNSFEARSFSWRATAAALALFAVVIALMSYRASFYVANPDRPDGVHWVMQDFRDVVFYPARAFLDGRNPYNTHEYMEIYPVWHPLALYTPLSLLLNSPFAMMPFQLAWQVYLVFSLLLLTALAAICLTVVDLKASAGRVALVSALLLLSRPGQMNFHLGQVGLQTAITATLAVFCANRSPWLAAVALALSTIKPTYGAPLCVLLVARGDWRLVVRALLLAAGPTAVAILMLLQRAGGIEQLLASWAMTYHSFGTESFDDPMIGPFRIDAPALIARLSSISMTRSTELLIGTAVLAVGAYAVYRCGRSEPQNDPRMQSGTLIILTMLACTYHQTYDALALALPVVGLVADHLAARPRKNVLRIALIVLFGLIAANYLATVTALQSLNLHGKGRLGATSINPGAICLALAIYVGLALRRRDRPSI